MISNKGITIDEIKKDMEKIPTIAELTERYIKRQLIWDLDQVISELKIKWDDDKCYYDEQEAKKFYKFVGKLELDKGKKGQKIKLIRDQFIICTEILCIKNKRTKKRRFREAHINVPRKNGKSFIIGLIATYIYFTKNEFGSEIILASNSSQLANLLFNTIHHMVKTNKTLKKYVKITDSRKYMYKKNMNSYLRVISSDAANADSYAGFICILDEIHEAKNRNLYDKLRTGMGIWDEPLLITITTASSGEDPHNLEYEIYTHAKNIEKGEYEDERFYYAIYEADENCNIMDREQWFKSNFALGTFRKLEDLADLAIRATRIKTQEAAFRRLYLNQHVALDGEGAIPMHLWDSCVRDVKLADLQGMPSWDGLDMASVQDITAKVKIFYDEDSEKYIVYPFLFTPKDTLHERVAKDDVRYDVYVEDGDLIALPGKSIDFEKMYEYMENINEIYDFQIQEIAFDRWGAVGIRSKLEKKYTVLPFGQGFANMSPAIKDFENLLLDQDIIIADNKFLRWMAQNVVAVMDDAANIKYSKKKSKNKIDGIIAMIMGLSRAVFNKGEGKFDINEYSTEEMLKKLMG